MPPAESVVCGYESQSSSKTGVSAWLTALPGPASARPQPSRMINASDGTGTDDGPVGIAHGGCSADREEVLRVERRAADQTAVDVFEREQLGRVGRLDRAAVEDPDRIGRRAIALRDQPADERACLVGLLWRRGAAGADRPDRLVGDDHAREVGVVDLGEVGRDLALEHRLDLVAVALGLGLATAQERQQVGREQRGDLARERLVGLAEQLAALGVADDRASGAEVGEHRDRDLAGEGAGLLGVNVLSEGLDPASAGCGRRRLPAQ